MISRQIGIRGASASHGPRLHDFRHRFAVQTLLRWHSNGEDVRRRLPTLSTYLGHAHVTDTYWYVTGTPELMAAVGQRLEKRWGGYLMKDAAAFPTLLEMFFTRRLIAQRRASPHTIASYRDTFRLLLKFAEKRLAKVPSGLTMEDLNAPFLGAFLDHLESARANGARSRNLRLTVGGDLYVVLRGKVPASVAAARSELLLRRRSRNPCPGSATFAGTYSR